MKMNYDDWSQDELRKLRHNDCTRAFNAYLKETSHSKDKKKFLYNWIAPQESDHILECGSSSGRTGIDIAKRSGCRITGIDFDREAVRFANHACKKFFPELENICRFRKDDLTIMGFDRSITKIIMPDFTEHIPDRVFAGILANIRSQLPDIPLYIYTPARTHVFDILKHNSIILKNPEGHINVKSEKSLKGFLEKEGWEIIDTIRRPSHVPFLRHIEKLLGKLPAAGVLFHRKIAVIARPRQRERTHYSSSSVEKLPEET